MNFLTAFSHAIIGYAIRRKEWPADVILHWEHNSHQLCWHNVADVRKIGLNPCRVCPVEDYQEFYDLSQMDINQTDWEVI